MKYKIVRINRGSKSEGRDKNLYACLVDEQGTTECSADIPYILETRKQIKSYIINYDEVQELYHAFNEMLSHPNLFNIKAYNSLTDKAQSVSFKSADIDPDYNYWEQANDFLTGLLPSDVNERIAKYMKDNNFNHNEKQYFKSLLSDAMGFHGTMAILKSACDESKTNHE